MIKEKVTKNWLCFGRYTKKVVGGRYFGPVYVGVALLVLLATTTIWSWQSAELEYRNADQLADPYLFENGATFNQAVFPGAHTFLLKWPLFWLLRISGYNHVALSLMTVLVVLVTVFGFVYILSRIERRPLILGTLVLALSSVLVMVPAQPYAGGLLPVNMAMLTTRNLEYLVFMISGLLLVNVRTFKSWRFVAASLLLAILVASDKLFLSLAVGGALLMLIGYALAQKWKFVALATKWLVGGAVAGIVATLLLLVITKSHLTTIAGTGTATPYGASSLKGFLVGFVYGIFGVLTNFGANPAYDAVQLSQVPRHAIQGLLTLGGFSYGINLLLFALIFVASAALIIRSFKRGAKQKQSDSWLQFVLLLLSASIASGAVFVVSNHYYAVDARYLTLVLFAGFAALALSGKTRKIAPEYLVLTAVILLVSNGLGIFAATHRAHQQVVALDPIFSRNKAVAAALARHHVNAVAGDYWRVLPLKQALPASTIVTPLTSCTTPREALSSGAWQPDLKTHSFAYLLSFDKGLTDYPSCSVQTIIRAYGQPSSSSLIAGSAHDPTELLLFYDHGAHPAPDESNKAHAVKPSDLLPESIASLAKAVCDGPTVMNVVAHEDDDLLFTSPDLIHSIQAGNCVRTIYLTAGDAGSDRLYWLGRERGSEAAYDTMLGMHGMWIEKTVELNKHESITVATSKSNPYISLLFMHLPDGGLWGQGFSGSQQESLAKLEEGSIKTITSIDGSSYYSKNDLIGALSALINAYKPSEIRTQAQENQSDEYPDHSDHIMTGRLTAEAYSQSGQTVPLNFYTGYPIHGWPENVAGDDLVLKEAAFMAYAKHDNGVCHSVEQCQDSTAYGAYLTRQYVNQ